MAGLITSEYSEVIIIEKGVAGKPGRTYPAFINLEGAGVTGPQGETGSTGETGAQGSTGAAGQDGGLAYYHIKAGETLAIPAGRQHLVKGPITVDGAVIVIGQEVII